MIYGPIVPLTRDSIRRLVCERPELLERGLRFELADLDVSRGRLGSIDALCRDAAGGAVLVIVTEPGDLAVVARVANAIGFVRRNARAMARALPGLEARLGDACRCFVVGADIGDAVVEDLRRLGLAELEILGIEPFRVGKDEHLAIRQQHAATAGKPDGDELGPAVRQLWSQLLALLSRIDPAVVIDGDRYSRRVSCHGRQLCEFWLLDDRIEAGIAGGGVRTLAGHDDVRAFVDSVLRCLLGRPVEARAPGQPEAKEPALPASRALLPGTLGSLRASLSASRLTREEYSALGEAIEEGEPPRSG